MARKELIRELSIRRNEIYDDLRKDNPKAVSQLEAIDSMMEIPSTEDILKKGGTSKRGVGTPKGDYNWIDYVLVILKEIGGSGKTSEVAEAIAKANPDISFRRAKNASGDKLSKLARSGKIKAIKGKSPIDGYTYEVI